MYKKKYFIEAIKIITYMSDEFEDLSTDLDIDEIEEVEPKSKISAKKPSSKTPSGSKVNVYFQSTIGPSQKQEKMLVSNDAAVGDVKYTVGQIFNLSPDDFHLSHAGRTLDPDDIFGNYDVEEGDNVLLIPVSTAGNSL